MKRAFTGLVFMMLPFQAWAQNMWGTGVYGGMQSCPYQTRAGNGAVSMDDTTKEIITSLSEAQTQLKSKKSELKKLERQVERSKSDFSKNISETYTDFIFEHVENARRCEEYKGFQTSAPSGQPNDMDFIVDGTEGKNSIKAPPRGQNRNSEIKVANENLVPIQGFTLTEWNQYCDSTKPGSINTAICSNARFRQYEDGNRSDAQTCKKSLTEYRKGVAQTQKLQKEIERLEDTIARSKEDLKDAKQTEIEDRKNGYSSQTEGDVCIECMRQGNGYAYQQNQTDWSSSIGNIALGLGSIYMGYKTNEMVADYNSSIGWPTNSYNSYGYGYGLGALATGVSQAMGGGGGIYGAISGGVGSGSFGCAGNNGGSMGMMGAYGGANGNGMWGNPYAMSGYGSLGGGMYNTGMGPWGMNGMNYPYGNMYGNMYGGLGSMYGGSYAYIGASGTLGTGTSGINSSYTYPYSSTTLTPLPATLGTSSLSTLGR